VRQAAYQPIEPNVEAYQEMFEEYQTLHDYFGRGANDVMHRLRERRRARKEQG
jgi:L-ribulokinase